MAGERIEEQHLRNIVGIGLQQDPSQCEEALRFFMATVLLRHYLGTAWCNECAIPGQTDIPRRSRAGRLFLRTDHDGREDRYRYQERLERLAMFLYKLQDSQGIASRLASIRDGHIESTYAELEFAWHFVWRGVQIRFLDRCGIKGRDYDFDAGEETSTVCCEVKCKLESTDLGENTIVNALDAARKQTPAERAAIIGVKIPKTWIRESALGAMFDSALASFFRNSSRVVAVVVRWEEVTLLAGGGGMTLYKFRPYPNEGSRHLTNDVWRIVQQLTQSGGEAGFRDWWRRLVVTKMNELPRQPSCVSRG
jgi:hypothetical protein